MENNRYNNSEQFVKDYMTSYSNRDLRIVPFIHEDFMGMDGISVKIYNQKTWIEALEHDYKEIVKPFKIKFTDCETRELNNGHILVTLISLWFISLFENAPEFDKMRSVFILIPTKDSYKIVHQSNSLSLLPMNKEDVYPTELLRFLKIYKASNFGNIDIERKL